MVTEFKGEDIDPPVNAVTETVKDHTKQSYEEQESDTPVITAATTYPPWKQQQINDLKIWFYAFKIKWFEDMILCIQNQQLFPATPIYMLEAVNVILYIYIRICT